MAIQLKSWGKNKKKAYNIWRKRPLLYNLDKFEITSDSFQKNEEDYRLCAFKKTYHKNPL